MTRFDWTSTQEHHSKR